MEKHQGMCWITAFYTSLHETRPWSFIPTTLESFEYVKCIKHAFTFNITGDKIVCNSNVRFQAFLAYVDVCISNTLHIISCKESSYDSVQRKRWDVRVCMCVCERESRDTRYINMSRRLIHWHYTIVLQQLGVSFGLTNAPKAKQWYISHVIHKNYIYRDE